MDGLEEGDVVVEDEVDTGPLLRGRLAYIDIWYRSAAADEKGREVGWEVLVNFEPCFLSKLQTYLHHL